MFTPRPNTFLGAYAMLNAINARSHGLGLVTNFTP